MQPKNSPAVVCDAGPIIHLDEMNCLDLLSDFARVLIPIQVQAEVVYHRPNAFSSAFHHTIVRPQGSSLPQYLDLMQDFALHRGEQAAIALALQEPHVMLLCDDSAARLAAETLGIRVHGTIGIIVRAIRQHQRTRDQVLEILHSLPTQSTLHIRPRLLQQIIQDVTEADCKLN